MGERLARELLALIARGGREPAQVMLETELLIRESALRPAAEIGRLAGWSQRTQQSASPKRPNRRGQRAGADGLAGHVGCLTPNAGRSALSAPRTTADRVV